MNEEKRTIIFFDGICHLCNGFVDFLLQRQSEDHPYYFAPLQGQTAAQLLSLSYRQEMRSLLLLHKGQFLQKSEAIFLILSLSRGWTKGLVVLKIVPRIVRDRIYDWVATNRLHWFGERDSCRLPGPGESQYLLP